jgi:hypothetical protein
LVTLARTKSREQFAAALPNPFLVLSTDKFATPSIAFRTIAVAGRPGVGDQSPSSLDLEIIEVTKAQGNPYPERISLGRARNCDVVIRDPSVSKLHAHFRVLPSRALELIDFGSQNGTRVNGAALTPNVPVPVRSGDGITLGRVSATLMDADALYDTLRLLTNVEAAYGKT